MRTLKTWWPFLIVTCLAALYRVYLSGIYYGWEESDYGNLAMARGVLESGFRHYDMRHLPLYYLLSAVVLALIDGTIQATHFVSLVSGVAAVFFAMLIADRVFDRRRAIVVGLLLCFQPEFALYAASSLREPLYTSLVLAGCYALLRGRHVSSALFTGLSFLTRFDTLGANMPATMAKLVRRPQGFPSLRHPLWPVLGIFAAFVAGWSVYCRWEHGTFLFFLPTIEVNIETGGARELLGSNGMLTNGVLTALALLFKTLPNHIGWLPFALALLSFVLHRRRLLGAGAIGTMWIYLVLNTLFWMTIGFVAQHEPEHNLYWKWMFVLVPFWMLFAADGLVFVLERLMRYRVALAVVAAISSLAIGHSFHRQTTHQLEMSSSLYRPQVELAQWVEERVPSGTNLIFDNIPACYINRKPHGWSFHSWFDIEIEPGSPAALARYIRAHDIRYVLWFKEDWTQAPRLAPYLSEPRVHQFESLVLTPLFQEPEYGFIFYEVGESDDASSRPTAQPRGPGRASAPFQP